MKRWLSIIALAVGIAFASGIGETQTKSQFPKVDTREIVDVEFSNCGNVVFSIVGYSNNTDLRYYVYEVGDVVFAVVEFDMKSDNAKAIYILRLDKSVIKFLPAEFRLIESPCKTIEILKLTNERNSF